jgi:predicted ester cyclase
MRKLLWVSLLVFLLCFIFACQDKEARAELEEFRAQVALEEQNKALILQWHEELDKANIDACMEMFSPDFLWYAPSNSPTPMSKEKSHEYMIEGSKAFPKMIHKIEEIMTAGDKVIARTIDYLTHEGEYRGIPATGKKIEFSVIVILQVIDGKIVEIREEVDLLGAIQQIGLELKLKEGER